MILSLLGLFISLFITSPEFKCTYQKPNVIYGSSIVNNQTNWRCLKNYEVIDDNNHQCFISDNRKFCFPNQYLQN